MQTTQWNGPRISGSCFFLLWPQSLNLLCPLVFHTIPSDFQHLRMVEFVKGRLCSYAQHWIFPWLDLDDSVATWFAEMPRKQRWDSSQDSSRNNFMLYIYKHAVEISEYHGGQHIHNILQTKSVLKTKYWKVVRIYGCLRFLQPYQNTPWDENTFANPTSKHDQLERRQHT